MCSCHSNIECCVTFSGVKLSIRSFVLFIEVINTAYICRGVFTRIKATKKKVEKSVLDYVIVSNQFKDQFLSCLIDEDKQLTPWRNLKKGRVKSDHNSILFSFTCLPKKVKLSQVGQMFGILTTEMDGKNL